jgi:predicted phage terminase large subunit-like protein
LPVETEQRTDTKPPLIIHSTAECDREFAKRHHLDFVQLTWQRPDPFIIGRHTQAICEKIDEAIGRYRSGESVFLIITVPFRHGKSDLLSRYLPPKFLGEFPDAEIMLATYAADLAGDLSRFARSIMRSPQYARLFPGIRVSDESSAVDRWGIQGRLGGMSAVGLGGAITGRGYALGVVDDYLKNREEAESETIRNKRWTSFTDDFLTRRAPTSITIVLATRWHVDDLIGRALKRMTEDSEFPQFEVLKFPAFSDEYPEGVLFPERFSQIWYRSQRATLGTYGTASLLQGEPTVHEGNLLKTAMVQIIEPEEIPDHLAWARVWDLAHSAKQRVKDDPDWTVGTLQAYDYADGPEGPLPRLWIRHVKRLRENAPERDKEIRQTIMSDGPMVRVGIECGPDSKDAFETMTSILKGARVPEEIIPHTDKVVRAQPLEAIFEAGNVMMVRGDWNQDCLAEAQAFPTGAHDDFPDTLSGGYKLLIGDNTTDPALSAFMAARKGRRG